MQKVNIPEYRRDQMLFETHRDVVRSAVLEDIRYVVYVDAGAYDAIGSSSDKVHVARIIGRINRALVGQRFILMGPGRWGSNNIDLGVKVAYGDINNASMLIELAEERGGYTPEVSFGTHFFQDLIEADIIPLPIYPDSPESGFNRELILQQPNALRRIISEQALTELRGADEVVRVVDIHEAQRGTRLDIFLDAPSNRAAALLRDRR
jgi:hypothetical protein